MIGKVMKQTKKPKLSDAERHKRFVEVGRLVGASDKSEDFDSAFDSLDIKRSVVGDDQRKRYPRPSS